MAGLNLTPHHPLPSEIRAARAYAGMSRKQVGDRLGVSAQVIGRWERGQFSRAPTYPMLAELARVTKPPGRFEYVTTEATKPSIAERARAAALRLDGTQDESPGTDDAQDAGGEGQ